MITIHFFSRPNRQKRPDRAVYVPRHRRGAPEVETSNVPVKDAQTKLPKEMSNSNPKVRSSRITNDKINAQSTTTDSTVNKLKDQEVEAPENTDAANEINLQKELASADLPLSEIHPEQVPVQNVVAETIMEIDIPSKHIDESAETQPREENIELANGPACLEESDKRDRRKSIETNEDSNNTSDMPTSSSSNDIPCDTSMSDGDKSEVQELPNSPTNPRNFESDISKRSEKVVQQPLVSKVLVISSAEDKSEKPKTASPQPTPVVPLMPPEKRVKKIERPKSKPAAPPAPPVKIDRDECDWDSLFDDNGDCLDPTLIDEVIFEMYLHLVHE